MIVEKKRTKHKAPLYTSSKLGGGTQTRAFKSARKQGNNLPITDQRGAHLKANRTFHKDRTHLYNTDFAQSLRQSSYLRYKD